MRHGPLRGPARTPAKTFALEELSMRPRRSMHGNCWDERDERKGTVHSWPPLGSVNDKLHGRWIWVELNGERQHSVTLPLRGKEGKKRAGDDSTML